MTIVITREWVRARISICKQADGKLQTSDFILNKPIVDEVGYRFWMRLNADCGKVGCRLWRLGLSTVCDRILQPRSRIRGNAWIELQNGKKLVEILNRIRCTEDPAKSLRTIAHSVRLQGIALVSYRLLTRGGWQGNVPFRV